METYFAALPEPKELIWVEAQTTSSAARWINSKMLFTASPKRQTSVLDPPCAFFRKRLPKSPNNYREYGKSAAADNNHHPRLPGKRSRTSLPPSHPRMLHRRQSPRFVPPQTKAPWSIDRCVLLSKVANRQRHRGFYRGPIQPGK